MRSKAFQGHEPFPIEFGHVMHLVKGDFPRKTLYGILQTDEIFSQVPSALQPGQSLTYKLYHQELGVLLSAGRGPRCDLKHADIVERSLFTRQRSTCFQFL